MVSDSRGNDTTEGNDDQLSDRQGTPTQTTLTVDRGTQGTAVTEARTINIVVNEGVTGPTRQGPEIGTR